MIRAAKWSLFWSWGVTAATFLCLSNGAIAETGLRLGPTYASVKTASSPDNTFQVLSDFFNTAEHTIKISVYEFDNVDLANVLVELMKSKKLDVTILFDGAPIPKVPEQELYVAKTLMDLGAKVYFYASPDGRASRQFKFLHAKYAIIDSKRVAVGSANYGSGGHPSDTSFGNREWEVILENKDIAKTFEGAFDHDIAIENEVILYGSDPKYTLSNEDFEPNTKNKSGTYDLGLESVEESNVLVNPIFAPDNSLYTGTKKNQNQAGPILAALDEAETSVDIEQLNIETFWGNKAYNPNQELSPLVEGILAQARKGLSMRVLLNDDSIFYGDGMKIIENYFFGDTPESDPLSLDSILATKSSDRDNKATIKYLNKISKSEGLHLYSKSMDYKKCGTRVLHNKGMIVDEMSTVVGSLNWGESALKFNREAGVLVKSRNVAAYYKKAFDYDWNCSK